MPETVSVKQGGTGANTAAGARSQLGVQQSLAAITAAQSFNNQGIHNYSIISEEVTSTTYTFVAADNGKQKIFTAATAITATVPTGLPVGFNCMAAQSGAGQITIASGGGVTLVNRQNQFKTAGLHAVASILPRLTANDYRVVGDTAA